MNKRIALAVPNEVVRQTGEKNYRPHNFNIGRWQPYHRHVIDMLSLLPAAIEPAGQNGHVNPLSDKMRCQG
jgi:hypothetical protein